MPIDVIDARSSIRTRPRGGGRCRRWRSSHCRPRSGGRHPGSCRTSQPLSGDRMFGSAVLSTLAIGSSVRSNATVVGLGVSGPLDIWAPCSPSSPCCPSASWRPASSPAAARAEAGPQRRPSAWPVGWMSPTFLEARGARTHSPAEAPRPRSMNARVGNRVGPTRGLSITKTFEERVRPSRQDRCYRQGQTILYPKHITACRSRSWLGYYLALARLEALQLYCHDMAFRVNILPCFASEQHDLRASGAGRPHMDGSFGCTR